MEFYAQVFRNCDCGRICDRPRYGHSSVGNVALSTGVTSGSQVTPGGIWWDTRVAGFSDGPPFVTGEFNFDGPNGSSNWDGYIPAVQINAS
jgi:hypothetical protein